MPRYEVVVVRAVLERATIGLDARDREAARLEALALAERPEVIWSQPHGASKAEVDQVREAHDG